MHLFREFSPEAEIRYLLLVRVPVWGFETCQEVKPSLTGPSPLRPFISALKHSVPASHPTSQPASQPGPSAAPAKQAFTA